MLVGTLHLQSGLGDISSIAMLAGLCEVPPCVCVQELNNQLKARPVAEDKFAKWRQEVQETNAAFPLAYPKRTDVIMPQWAIEVCRHAQFGRAYLVTVLQVPVVLRERL